MEAAAGDDRRRRGEEGVRPPGRGAGRGHGPARGGHRAARPTRSPRAPASVPRRRSIWPAIHPRLLELVRAHRSTILFVNSRRLAERLAAALNELAGEEIARAHHGSIAREQRLQIEDALKAGRLPALVATSSLELGIDMGAVDLVVQIETPPSVASGHAAHRPRQPPGGGRLARRHLPEVPRRPPGDAPPITRAMKEGAVEETRVPQNPLDVLAQQLVAIGRPGRAARSTSSSPSSRRAAPSRALGRARSSRASSTCSPGRYPSDEFAELRPRARLGPPARDGARARGRAAARRRERRHHPRPRALRRLPRRRPRAAARRVGELDEEMVFESREGEVFVLGASSWRIAEITRDRVLVVPAPGEPGQDAVLEGRPRRAAGGAGPRASAASPASSWPRAAGRGAASGCSASTTSTPLRRAEPRRRTSTTSARRPGALPDDRTLVLERTRDEMGDWRLCLLSPWGGRVHAPWALALEARLRQRGRGRGRVGLERRRHRGAPARARAPARGRGPPARARGDRGPRGAASSAARASSPRASARRRRGRCSSRGGGRASARRSGCSGSAPHDLLQVAARYPSFPIVLEAYRECLQDVFDLPALVELARARAPPRDPARHRRHAGALALLGVAPLRLRRQLPLRRRRAARRAARAGARPSTRRSCASSSARRSCASCSTAGPSPSWSSTLQGLDAAHRATSPDRLHDLLLRLGDLSPDEVAARVAAAPESGDAAAAADAWLAALERERRAIRGPRRGRGALRRRRGRRAPARRARHRPAARAARRVPRAAAARAARARRALRAHARAVHGRATSARRFGDRRGARSSRPSPSSWRDGRVLEGEFRPGRPRPRVVRGRRARDAAPPLARRAAARRSSPPSPRRSRALLVDWQGVAPAAPPRAAAPTRSSTSSSSCRARSFPPRSSSATCCRARLPGYRPEDLDTLCAAGEVVWVGLGPLGDRDGRLALFLADDLPLLLPPRPEPPAGRASHDRIREHLAAPRRVVLRRDPRRRPGGGLAAAVVDALWDLAWAGEVTNDTPAALRAFLAAHAARAERRAPRVGLPLAPAGPARGRGPLEPPAAAAPGPERRPSG